MMKFTFIDSRFNTDLLMRRLKLLTLITGIALLSSGCAMSQFKQRENALNQQQQQLEEQQQQLGEQQQLLQKENSRLTALKAALSQEQMRLSVLKKSLNSVTDESSSQAGSDSHVIVGELEYVYISPPNIQLSARIDTGAKTSSLNALDLTEFERDGKPHVRFYITNPDTNEKVKVIRRVIRHVKIKEHEGESKSRPVVRMRVRLGNLDQRVRMTLTDRSEFKNQVLIGRNFLRDFANVDVSKKFVSKPVFDSQQ